MTRHRDRVTRSEPRSDQQLHDRIRARLGRVISHPKSVHVGVSQGHGVLTGHILTQEDDKLLDEVKHAGVTAVDNQLVATTVPKATRNTRAAPSRVAASNAGSSVVNAGYSVA